MGVFTQYETGLTRLLERLGSEHSRYADVLVYQQRLRENISQARKYGDTDVLKHARAQILDSLNRITQESLNMPFNALCESTIQQPGEIHTAPSVTAPPLIDIYSDREDWLNLPDPSYATALPGSTPSSLNVQEWLYSNLLPIVEHPTIIYSAPSPHRNRSQIRALMHDTYTPPFVPKEKRLWTFSDLTQPDCPLRRACDVGEITKADAAVWWHDDSRRLWLVDLYNQCLRRKCFSLGLLFDWQHKRFYFPPDGDRERVIGYQARKRRASRRVAYSYRSWFWVHQAVRLSFAFIADQWYLKVEPAYTFTKDGVEFVDSRKVGPLSTRRKVRDYNQNVFNHLVFWREFLSSRHTDITILCGDQQMVISKYYERGRSGFGIPSDQAGLLAAEPVEPDIGEELFSEPSEEEDEADFEKDEDDDEAE
jgi:hypothetical protein